MRSQYAVLGASPLRYSGAPRQPEQRVSVSDPQQAHFDEDSEPSDVFIAFIAVGYSAQVCIAGMNGSRSQLSVARTLRQSLCEEVLPSSNTAVCPALRSIPMRSALCPGFEEGNKSGTLSGLDLYLEISYSTSANSSPTT